jgi:hypothetical protein
MSKSKAQTRGGEEYGGIRRGGRQSWARHRRDGERRAEKGQRG